MRSGGSMLLTRSSPIAFSFPLPLAGIGGVGFGGEAEGDAPPPPPPLASSRGGIEIRRGEVGFSSAVLRNGWGIGKARRI
jgi:hypothetical protein